MNLPSIEQIAGSSRRVAVIGAGISGLCAARTLHDHGITTVIFDKGRGPAGRSATRRRNGLHFDHGAQYFTVRDERFRGRVNSWIEQDIVRQWTGTMVTIAGEQITADRGTRRYVGVPGMNAIARHLAAGLEVHHGQRINGLRRRQRKWQVIGEHGQRHGPFDEVMVTLPAPQAVDLLAEAPTLAGQIAGLRFAPCWAVMVHLPQRLATRFDGAVVYGSPLSWVARNNSKPQRPREECWVLHAGPQWSAEHLEDDPHAVASSLLESFFEVVAAQPMLPRHIEAHRWRYALPLNPLSAGHLRDEELAITLSGDWCRGNRLEAAFLSGLSAAEAIRDRPC